MKTFKGFSIVSALVAATFSSTALAARETYFSSGQSNLQLASHGDRFYRPTPASDSLNDRFYRSTTRSSLTGNTTFTDRWGSPIGGAKYSSLTGNTTFTDRWGSPIGGARR